MRFHLCCLLLLALLVSGCTGAKRQEARGLVQQGYAVSTSLEGFYKELVSDSDSFQQIVDFDAALQGKPADVALLTKVAALRKAAKARERAAGHLSDLYESLGEMMNYDARASVQGAAANLQASLGSVGDSPVSWGGISVDPIQVLQQIDADIAIARQEKRVEHQAPVVLKTVKVVADLFEKEAPQYVSLQQDYLSARRDFGKALLGRGEAIPDTILISQLKALGLRYDPGPVVDDRERSAINQIIDTTTEHAMEELKPRTTKLISKLRSLEAAHRQFSSAKR